MAPLPSTIQCAAGFRAGGLRVTDVFALPHLLPSALKGLFGFQGGAASPGVTHSWAKALQA